MSVSNTKCMLLNIFTILFIYFFLGGGDGGWVTTSSLLTLLHRLRLKHANNVQWNFASNHYKLRYVRTTKSDVIPKRSEMTIWYKDVVNVYVQVFSDPLLSLTNSIHISSATCLVMVQRRTTQSKYFILHTVMWDWNNRKIATVEDIVYVHMPVQQFSPKILTVLHLHMKLLP